MNRKKICIMGATSHIAKNLIYYFLECDSDEVDLYLYARDDNRIYEFINRNCQDFSFKGAVREIKRSHIISEFMNYNSFDTIINCTGTGTNPENLSDYFLITEKFDNLILDYLKIHSETLYINFSSGVVSQGLDLTNIQPKDYYTLAKINSETKHRSLKDLKIVDIRLYSFFSQFADVDKDSYFINEIVKCITNNTIFITDQNDFERDYIHPKDLYNCIMGLIYNFEDNRAIEVGSCFSVSKLKLLKELEKSSYKLKVRYISDIDFKTSTGQKIKYSPVKIYNNPRYDSNYSIYDGISEILHRRKDDQFIANK